ncbi:MAG: hypothetical protein EOM91_13770 [Sphingobacteriia bacterium]|nr:hypothetical protein [Sphingobacteriia bacterium]NCC40996.1 hypothetical protein [Gammaproteobacteria bacterium]
MTPTHHCSCGHPADYSACCGRYLDAGQLPDTAQALMRSRYVAYVQGRADYLLASWHPSTRPAGLDLDAEHVRWLGLQIRRVEAGGPDETHGVVEFIARYKIAGRAHRLHEVSRFIKQDGRWYYQDALATT